MCGFFFFSRLPRADQQAIKELLRKVRQSKLLQARHVKGFFLGLVVWRLKRDYHTVRSARMTK